MTVKERIQDFLGQKRFAMAGISRRPNDFSRMLFRELRRRGYDVVPVNPAASDVDGQRCFARVQEVNPPVDTVLLMTSPALTETVVRDCAAAGVKRVWMYRASGHGAVTADAVSFCELNNIAVIPGECPLMFLPGSAWFHRFHGFVRKIAGTYPN